jgi:hypothetical protein
VKVPRLPLIVAAMGAGFLVLGVADQQARLASAVSSLPLFWVAMTLIAAPPIWVLLGHAPTRHERISVVLLLGMAIYLVKVMASPLEFTLPDEFSHLRTLNDVLNSGHLFAENPLLPISSLYPALEAAAAAAMVSSGLESFPLALVLIATARVVGLLSLFHIAEGITSSARVAGIASLIYMANLSFLTFDAQFAYESLALPLALLAIWAVLGWSRAGGRSVLYASLALGAVAATAMTHHLTSFALLGFLSAWAVMSFIRPRGARPRWPIVVAAGWAATVNFLWFTIVGGLALQYLNIIVLGGVDELFALLRGALPPKRLFVTRPEFALPLPEIVVAYAATGLLLLALPFMLHHAFRRRSPPPIAVVLGLAALLYPVSLALRFTVTGSETSQRAAEFVFLPLGILGANWLLRPLSARWRSRPRALIAPLLFVVLAGGIVSGDPPQGRLPGPYYVAAEQLSIEPQGTFTASWASHALGPNNRLIADRTNAKLLGSIGAQYPVTASNQHLGTAYLMFRETMRQVDVDLLRTGAIRYVVVDLRLSRDIPVYKYYFESAEPDAGRHTKPLPLAALQKFDGLRGVTRIYDSGDIVIYDMRDVADVAP